MHKILFIASFLNKSVQLSVKRGRMTVLDMVLNGVVNDV